MKKHIIKILSGLVITFNLFSINAFANDMVVSGGKWMQYNTGDWLYDMGGSYAHGWTYIDGYWYFFDPYTGIAYKGNDIIDSNGMRAFTDSSMKEINGKCFVFDHNCQLVRNENIQVGRIALYHADDNGYLTDLN